MNPWVHKDRDRGGKNHKLKRILHLFELQSPGEGEGEICPADLGASDVPTRVSSGAVWRVWVWLQHLRIPIVSPGLRKHQSSLVGVVGTCLHPWVTAQQGNVLSGSCSGFSSLCKSLRASYLHMGLQRGKEATTQGCKHGTGPVGWGAKGHHGSAAGTSTPLQIHCT